MEPVTKKQPRKKKPADPAVAALFALFWAKYPRKLSKKKARESYTRAVHQVPPETILAGLDRAIAVWETKGTETQFVPHPTTWLNQARWEDEDEGPGFKGPPTQTFGNPLESDRARADRRRANAEAELERGDPEMLAAMQGALRRRHGTGEQPQGSPGLQLPPQEADRRDGHAGPSVPPRGSGVKP